MNAHHNKRLSFISICAIIVKVVVLLDYPFGPPQTLQLDNTKKNTSLTYLCQIICFLSLL